MTRVVPTDAEVGQGVVHWRLAHTVAAQHVVSRQAVQQRRHAPFVQVTKLLRPEFTPALARALALVGSSPKVVRLAAASAASAEGASPRAFRSSRLTCGPSGNCVNDAHCPGLHFGLGMCVTFCRHHMPLAEQTAAEQWCRPAFVCPGTPTNSSGWYAPSGARTRRTSASAGPAAQRTCADSIGPLTTSQLTTYPTVGRKAMLLLCCEQ